MTVAFSPPGSYLDAALAPLLATPHFEVKGVTFSIMLRGAPFLLMWDPLAENPSEAWGASTVADDCSSFGLGATALAAVEDCVSIMQNGISEPEEEPLTPCECEDAGTACDCNACNETPGPGQ